MPDPMSALSGTPKRVGIAADHAGCELGAERHCRRLAKVAELEKKETRP
jgi:hypothetical protein